MLFAQLMGTRGRIIAGLAAGVGWAGAALQLALLVDKFGPAAGLWRFLGFFTILTNIGAAAVATAVALGRSEGLAGPPARLMAATSILMVGIVYSLALRALWNPVGLQKLADVLLHDAAPLIWLVLWFIVPARRLKWTGIGWALLPPALYLAYALMRGAADGWYAYWFLDPGRQSPAELIASVALVLCGFAAVGAALVALARWLARPEPSSRESELIDQAGRESFPASDPPSWTLGGRSDP